MEAVFRMVATKLREMMIEALEHRCGVILPGEDHDLFIGPPSGPVSGAGAGAGARGVAGARDFVVPLMATEGQHVAW